MIDPSIWADERFGRLSPDGQVMFIGIISNADDEGRLPGNAAFLGATIFPFRGLSVEQSTKIRDEILSVMRSLKLYQVDGCEYLQLLKFTQYQAINRPTASKYPLFNESSVIPHALLTPNRIEEKRIEEKRIEEEEKEETSGKVINSLALTRGQIMAFQKAFPGMSNQEIKDEAKKCSEYMAMSSGTYTNPGLFFRGWMKKVYAEWRKNKVLQEQADRVIKGAKPLTPEQIESNRKRIADLKSRFPLKTI
jgi:hypothetical protein